MTFAQERMKMSGILRGQGLIAQCTVSATRVTLLGSGLSKNCNIAIEWVSKLLPPGDYQLLFEGNSCAIRQSKGQWHVIQDAPK